MMMFRAMVAWFALMVIAIANDALREYLLVRRLGPELSHVVSTLLLCVFVFIVAKVGALWLALTLGFEFLAGHYIFLNSWERLLADYNILQGRIWVLVPIVTLLAPRLALASM